MVKVPRAGRVKTRLGREIGMTPAAWWFRHNLARLIRRLDDRRWRLVLAVAPDAEGLCARVWPPHIPRIPQGGGDLGDRMARVFDTLPTGPKIIIGADIPNIEPHYIARTFQALKAMDAVIGPAPDGGFWLVGLNGRRPRPPDLFKGVRWSTHHARADTLRAFKGLRVGQAAQLRDVDTADDLKAAFRRDDTRGTW